MSKAKAIGRQIDSAARAGDSGPAMGSTFRSAAIALFALPLAACGGAGASSVRSTAAPAAAPPKTVVRQPVRAAPLGARLQALPGLEAVIGAGQAELVRQFGPARLEVWEGDARKLQFVGTACVLDVYLYPPEKGREPEATYVDARRASDGQDVDRAGCVAALRKPNSG